MNEWLHQLGSLPRGLAALALFVGPAVGFGHALLPSNKGRSRLEALLLSLAVGLNALAIGALIILPAANLLGSTGRYGALIATEAVGWWLLMLAWPHLAPRVDVRGQTGGTLCILLCVLGFFAAPAFCYPTGWDDLVYHAVLPLRWLADGTPRIYGDLPYSGFPALGEIVFWTLAHLEGLIAPRLFIWTCWVTSVIMLFCLLKRSLAPWVAVAMVLAYALSRTQLMLAANTYVESLIALDLAAVCLLLREVQEHRRNPWRQRRKYLALIGALTGAALAVKLTGAVTALIPVAWVLTPGLTRSRQSRARDLAILTGAALAMAAPFYIRPWIATGNPVYPYFDSLFSQDQARQAASQFHHAIGRTKFGMPGVLAFVAAPLLLAFDYDVYDGAYGWQWILVLASIAFGRRSLVRHPLARCSLIGAAGMYVFWQLTAQQARFLVPAVLAIYITAGPALGSLRASSQRAVAVLLVVAALAGLPFERSGYYAYSWLTALGRVPLADYIHTGTDEAYLPAADAVLSTCSPSDRVLLLFEHRSLYIPRPCTIGTPFFQSELFTESGELRSPAAVLDVLHSANVSHVLMALTSGGPDQIPAYVERMRPLAQSIGLLIKDGKLQKIWESDSHMLCKVMDLDEDAETPALPADGTPVNARTPGTPETK